MDNYIDETTDLLYEQRFDWEPDDSSLSDAEQLRYYILEENFQSNLQDHQAVAAESAYRAIGSIREALDNLRTYQESMHRAELECEEISPEMPSLYELWSSLAQRLERVGCQISR